MTDRRGKLSSPRRATLLRVLKWTIGLTILALVLVRVEWRQLVRVLVGVDMRWVLAAYSVFMIDRLWMAGKWWYLLRGLGVRVRFFDTVRHYFAGGLVGTATQVQLGGDAFRVVALGREHSQTGRVAASVVIEKIVGALALGLWAIVAIAALDAQVKIFERPGGIAVLAGGLVAGILALGAVLFFGPAVARWVARRVPQVSLEEVVAVLRQARGSGRLATTFSLLTLAEQAAPVIEGYCFARALGLDLSLGAVLAVIPIIAFLGRLPISIDAFGMREGLSVVLFGWLGVSATEAVAMSLLSRAVDLTGLVSGAVACTALLHRRGKTSGVAGPVPRAAETRPG